MSEKMTGSSPKVGRLVWDQEDAGSSPVFPKTMSRSFSGQDAALSRRRREFDSPTGQIVFGRA